MAHLAQDLDQEDRHDLEVTFRNRYWDGGKHHNDFHEQAKRDFEFYALHQWEDDEIKWAQKVQLPQITIPQTFVIINAVSGSEIVNRHEGKYLPRNVEDQGLADGANQTSRFIRQQSGAGFEQSAMFRSAGICGVGCIEWFADSAQNRHQPIQCSEVPFDELIWDPGSRKQNLTDARWVIRGRWIPEDEFNSMFPEADVPPQDIPASVDQQDTAGTDMWQSSPTTHVTYPTGYEHKQAKGIRHYDTKEKMYLVFEMQDYETEIEYVVEDPVTGEVEALRDEELRKKEADLAELVEDGEEVPKVLVIDSYPKRFYRRSWWAGDFLLEVEELPYKSFTYLFQTAFRDYKDGKTTWFGLVRVMRDPQRVVNRGLSLLLHRQAVSPKGALMIEETAVVNPQKLQEKWSQPSSIITVRDGTLANDRYKIVEGNYPADQERVASLFMDLVPRSVGINLAYFGGQAEDLRRTASSAVSQVQRQGQMMLSILFDSNQKYRVDEGRLLLDMMTTWMEEERMIRLVGEEASASDQQFVSFAGGDLIDKEFDIVVGEVPSSPTAQKEQWESLVQSGGLQILSEMGAVTAEDIPDMMPDLKEDARARMRQRAEERKQMEQKMMQAQAQEQVPPEGG